MSTSKITTIGLENYLNMEDKSLFDNLRLPEDINKNTLTDTILLASAEFEVLYPDPYYYRDAIALWGRKNYWTFDKWIKAINIEYDPLNNYDRTEEWTDEHEGSDERNKESSFNSSDSSNSNEDSTSRTQSLSESESSSERDTSSELNVSSYDSSSYQPREKTSGDDDVASEMKEEESSSTSTEGKSNNFSEGHGNSIEDQKGSERSNNRHFGRMYGNIGVTTSQQMLESELEIARFNIYDQIADLFITEFCLLVY